MSGKNGESEDGGRRDTLLLNVETRIVNIFFRLNESDGVSGEISSIQLSTEDIDLDEFFEDGL